MSERIAKLKYKKNGIVETIYPVTHINAVEGLENLELDNYVTEEWVTSNTRSSSWTPTWSQVSSKPTWIGSSKPTYNLGEILETTTYKRVTQSEKNTWNGKLGTDSNLPEANLVWGGKNFSSNYGPIDAAMVPELGANRLAFIPASAIVIEYSRDGGSTWTDYAATNQQKTDIFNGIGTTLRIGKNTSTGVDVKNYQLRITINTSAGSLYTALNKFVMLVSTDGSSGSWVTVDARLQSNVTANVNTWNTFSNKTNIGGWSGYNVINTSNITTYGNTPTSQYGQVRFTFGNTSNNTAYLGLRVRKIMGFGGVGWTTPSTLAQSGEMYKYNWEQNVQFPKEVYANGSYAETNMLTNRGWVTANTRSSSWTPTWDEVSSKPIITVSGTTTGTDTNPKAVSESMLKAAILAVSPAGARPSSWVNVSDKPTWIGTSKPTYTASDVGAAPTGEVVRSTTENKNILGTTESVFNISEKKVWFNKGALFYGTAAAAGLVTRGISGTTPTGNGKDHLYINYDGNNTLSRQVVLGAGSVGTNRGHGIYDYSAVRGDAFIAWLTANTRSSSWTPKWDQVSEKPTISLSGTTTGTDTTPKAISESVLKATILALSPAGSRPASDVSSWAKTGNSDTIPTSKLPALAITDTFEVATQSAMTTLTAQKGDIAIRTDLNKTFVLAAEPASTVGNWKELKTPTDAVLSVAGLTGAITSSSLKNSLSLNNVENKSSATIRGELTSANVTSALGFTPYNSTNPSGYQKNSDITRAEIEEKLTGAVTTITSSNLTANMALISNGSGKVSVSAVTSTELGYLDGVTSGIQGQLNGKAETSYVDGKIYLKSSTDNRSVNTAPNDYNSKFEIKGLKSNSTLGITGQGSYSALLGIRGWSDSSGGNSHEFALTGNGEIYHRHGATTSWNAWDVLVKQSSLDKVLKEGSWNSSTKTLVLEVI